MPTTMKLIAKQTLGSTTATVTFSSIPSTYTDLLLVSSARSNRAGDGDDGYIQFNAVGTGYSRRFLAGYSTTVASGTANVSNGIAHTYIPAANQTANTFSNDETYIPNYAGSANKSVSSTSVLENNAAFGHIICVAGLWSNTSAITSIVVGLGLSSYVSGSSFYLYGITKA